MTKRELAIRILTLLGVNTRTSSATAEEIDDTLKHTQDWMMANDAIGRRLGWVDNGVTADPSEDSGLPDYAIMGVANSMAIYLAPYFEKAVHPSIIENAGLGMQTIAMKTVEMQTVQYPTGFPRGQAGSVPYGPQYYYAENRIVTGGDYLTDEDETPITTP